MPFKATFDGSFNLNKSAEEFFVSDKQLIKRLILVISLSNKNCVYNGLGGSGF